MTSTGFAYPNLFGKKVPAAAPRWGGNAKYNFIGGHNDRELVPVEGLIEATASVLRREGAELALYSLAQGPQGYIGLRKFVAEKLGRWRGIKGTADDVLITSGSGQAIDLINQVLLEPGDTVILEEFTYGGYLTKLKRIGVNIVSAPLDEDGIKMDALGGILAGLKQKGVTPKYICTTATIQNPTGSIMPLDRRKQLLALAAEYGVPIFEDECYSDLTWGGMEAPPALYALDPKRVIHIGSFSKTLAPALRLGYVMADWDFMSRMVAIKTSGDSGTGALEQMIVAEYFSKHFEEHVNALSKQLKEKLDTMVEAVEREFGSMVEPWQPKGGIFLWMKLPDEVDVRKLVQPALKAGVAFNPGPEWAVDGEASKSRLRLCFGLTTKQEIEEGVALFAKVCYEETGIPEQSANIRRAR
ncbi:MAG TPA: PLP-dependent aminotransferase family protein [Stellaceae bacterium]|jgi:2-aminoadipate transaminase|nr:PLP-dependent aminotransferase family protein [Stellaceae bacterium]